jgi:branched-chain amino acid transport system permease protein
MKFLRPGQSLYILFLIAILITGLGMTNTYYLQLSTFIGIYTLLALGLNMLMGYAGQISLGHAAFYGLGAYTSGVLTVHWNWSPWLALPVTLLLTALVAFLVGLPTLKLTGYYLGMGTLGFGIIVHVLFREWGSLTGGASGLVGIPPLNIGSVSLSSGRGYFYLVWGTVFVCFIICERIVDSRVGRALRAIHDSEQAAAAMGVNTSRLKVSVFVLSAVFASLAGFLYAHQVSFISPGSFDFMVSIRLVAMVVIGGMATIWGALLGASLLTLLPEWLHVFLDYEMIVYGFILMVVMVFLPQGLTRGLLDIYERSKRKSHRPTVSSES